MKRLGGVFVITPGALAAIIVSWIALAAGGIYLAKISSDLSSERAARVVDACRRESTDRLALRRLIVFFEARTLANPTIKPKDKPMILAFYRSALKIIPPITC